MHLVPLAGTGDSVSYYSVDSFAREAGIDIRAIPACLRILAENVLRNVGHNGVTAADLESLLRWTPAAPETLAVPFHPARVLMQDYTGIPALVDLAALRDAMWQQGRDPARINPQIPVDLVIDHSLIVDAAGRRARRRTHAVPSARAGNAPHCARTRARC